MTEERNTFETFIREFRDFILALAKEPILSSSGIYEMVEVGRRTVADMENEMAHELINLPNKKAYVAIGSKGERYKPLKKTKPLPYTKQAESLLQIHKTQERRRRSGVTPTPVASVTAKEERKQPALPTTPHAIVRIPEETTPDTYL